MASVKDHGFGIQSPLWTIPGGRNGVNMQLPGRKQGWPGAPISEILGHTSFHTLTPLALARVAGQWHLTMDSLPVYLSQVFCP